MPAPPELLDTVNAGDQSAASCAALSAIGLAGQPQSEPSKFSFYFLKAAFLRTYKGNELPIFQEVREKHPEALVELALSYEDVIRGKYHKLIVSISHRWPKPGEPDPGGEQFSEIQKFLNGPQGRTSSSRGPTGPVCPRTCQKDLGARRTRRSSI